MKKRFLCLLLCAIMLLLSFAGCAEKTGEEVMEGIGEEASETAVTLTMYLMSEMPVSGMEERIASDNAIEAGEFYEMSEEYKKTQLALMEAKVNEITQEKFNVKIELNYFTPDTYYEELENDLALMKSYYADKIGENQVYETPEYVNPDTGLPQVWYPGIQSYNVDIFYFGGYDKYALYKDSGYLKDIKEEVDGASRAIKKAINDTLFSSFRDVTGGVYAIPTNRTVGEYTYLLLHKDALEKTKYDAKDFNSLTCDNAMDMLAFIDEYYSDTFVPLYSGTGELDVLGVKYFSYDENGMLTNDFSVLGGTYNPNWEYGAENSFPSMGDTASSKDAGYKSFSDQLNILKGYEFSGYYAEEDEADKPFAMGYIKGNATDVAAYGDDYVAVVVDTPTLETEDLFESMFAVSEYTSSKAKSVEIITYLNTNEEFRNLLLYGVEGENYTWTNSDILDEEGTPYRVVSRQTKDPNKLYVIDALKTGNVALAYTEDGQNPIENANIFDHNANLKRDLILGFSYYNGLVGGGVSAEMSSLFMGTKLEVTEKMMIELGLRPEQPDNPELADVKNPVTDEEKQAARDTIEAMTLSQRSDIAYYLIMNAENDQQLKAAIAEMNSAIASDKFTKIISDRNRSQPTPVAYYLNWLKDKGLWVPQMGE